MQKRYQQGAGRLVFRENFMTYPRYRPGGLLAGLFILLLTTLWLPAAQANLDGTCGVDYNTAYNGYPGWYNGPRFPNRYAFAALKADGSITAWGDSNNGGTGAPTDTGYVSIVSTGNAFAALKADGSITAWGSSTNGGTGAPTDTGYVRIVPNGSAFAAMRADGSINAWGRSAWGGTGEPTGTGFVSIASNSYAFAALKPNGAIKSWGGITGTPTDTGYVSIASTLYAFAALKADGSITAWGLSGGIAPITGTPTDTGYVSIVSTQETFVAMKADGSITAWGGDSYYDGSGAPTDTGYVSINGVSEACFQSMYPLMQPANTAPVITSDGGGATASVNVPENSTAVTTVTATDADGDTLSYTLSGTDAGLFTLDAATGVLAFNTAPDFESPADADTNNVYAITVTVGDSNGGTDVQALSITVTDVNEAPVITSDGGGNTAALDVAENTTAITTVIATDVDGDTLTYSISGGADSGLFTIDGASGVLAFTAAPDFETATDADTNGVYEVEVTADDSNGGTDVQALSITVMDVNETPVITSNGGGDTAAVSVAEGSTAVTTVTATDADGDTLNYTLSGTDAGLFTLDPATGVLTFNTAPDFETPTDADTNNVYDITVTADDSNGGTDVQALSVTVTNVDETVDSDGDGIDDGIDTAPSNPCLPVAGNTYAATNCVDLSLVKTGGTDQGGCLAGQLEWTITVANAGPADATGVKVTDAPVDGTVVNSSGTLVSTGDPVDCMGTDGCSIPNGDSVEMTVCTE
ncbi:MAG: cadherin domain-containing protein [Thiolinea sp.]